MTTHNKNALKRIWIPVGTTLCAVALCLTSGCTKNESTSTPSGTETTSAAQMQEAQATPSAGATTATTATTTTTTGGPTVNLSIGTDGNNLYYSQKSLDVKAGSTVNLTFKNNASSDSGLSHNWVLVKPGTADQVSSAGMQAGDAKGWIPDSPDIIAHTKLLKAGESETVTFTAPPPGDYPYLCTFPGHSTTMKGVLHSK